MTSVQPGEVGFGPRPRVLFIARAYPPTVGGMERFAQQLHDHLREHVDVVPLINRRGKKALPLFLPYAAAAAIRAVRRADVDAVHLADALLAPVGAAIKATTGVPVTASIHGLDITYANPAYQAIVIRALRRLDMVIANSGATEDAMRQRTGPSPRSIVIPLGVNPLPPPSEAASAEFARVARLPDDARVVLTVGRLIARKGVAWFVSHVMALLPDDVTYAVIGEGPEHGEILRAAAAAGVDARIRLLGRMSDEALAAAYARADVFVMPNLPVAGDMEGFGLVALEAAASGVPVIAANLEGITDAIRHGRNGSLVPPGDAPAFAGAIVRALALESSVRARLGDDAARFTVAAYGWPATAAAYARAIKEFVPAHESTPAVERESRQNLKTESET